MRYWVVFEIQPSGTFGVPEDGYTVVNAAKISGTATPPIASSMVAVGHGTLPLYREESQRIDEKLTLSGIGATLEDNYLHLYPEGTEYQAEFDRAVEAADRLLKHLTLAEGRSFSARPVHMETETRERCPIPRHMSLMHVTAYNLDDLRERVQEAAAFAGREDDRLLRSLAYLDHAVFLIGDSQRVGNSSPHQPFLIASIFLHIWKAIATIVGESGESDHQSRYRTLGLSHEFYTERIRKAQRLRDDHDVAHPNLDSARIDEVKSNYGEALETAREVIRRQRERLAAGTPAES